jgi:hypothetical protein
MNENIKITGKAEFIFTNVKTGEIRWFEEHNVITTVGKNSWAAGIIGTNNKAIITYCALGTGATAPAAGDIKLQTEIFRKLVSVRTSSANVATIETFFTIAEGNGSLKEAGLFGDDASATVDSGTLFSHIAINRTKTSSDTLTLRWTITFN